MNNEYTLNICLIEEFKKNLIENEKSKETISKYLRDVKAFYNFLPENKLVNKTVVVRYKDYLSQNYKNSSTNSMLAALNKLFSFLEWNECKVKQLKVQRKNFRESDKELSRIEYQRLLKAAKNRKNERLCLLIQAICSTGIRVSEHRFITVRALKEGVAYVDNKGKRRTVIIPTSLAKVLLGYCKRNRILSGSVFITKGGHPMDRSNIWSAMKQLGEDAGVDNKKVFPHNLRHLFAVTFYKIEKDIVRLADILGHSSIETTRIYLAVDLSLQRKALSRLNLLY